MEHVTFPVLDEECTRVETHEVIEVERDAGGALRLLHSPAMVAGIARGDLVAMDSSSLCGYRLIQRGGMLAAVVMFVSAEQRRDAERLLGLEVQSLGGVCEGGPGRALVFSLPVAAGFGVVEEFLRGAAARFDGAQWFFGNVFGPDGQPLNWWL